LTDGIFRRFGLSGKVSLCFSSGCACIVNGVISTRIIEEKSERNRAITAVSFMPCGAKIICLQYLSSFTKYPALATVLVIFICFFTSLVVAKIHLCFSGEKVFGDALFDLPTYRFPTIKEVFLLTKEKSLSFIKKAGKVIAFASIDVWFLSSFDFRFSFGAKDNILTVIASKLKYLFLPLGFYDERLTVAMIAGFFAKESIVAILAQGAQFYSGFSVLAYMVFVSLYPPCISALTTMRKEFSNRKYFYLSLLTSIICAYFSAMIINLLGLII
jgi:ferrous iron transport protein B